MIPRRKPLARSTKPIAKSGKAIVGKYASREWRNLRARVLRRDRNWCQGCNDQPATEVHHRLYGKGHHKKSLLVPMEELVSLCRRCHAEIHPWLSEEAA